MTKILRLMAALCLLGAVAAAQADLSPVAFRIEATNLSGTGSFEVPSTSLQYNPQTQTYTWAQMTPVDLLSGTGQVIATLDQAALRYVEDPQINLSFAVRAGQTNTTFTIQSALLSFPAISPARGRASAALTVTDTNNNGATLSGLGTPGTGVYLAQYNGFVPSGTTFSSLIATVAAGPGGSNAASQNDPAAGYRAIGVPVTDMSAQIAFTLTAEDLGSGTTNFEIIPEPATLTLLALGALALVRRR